MNKLTLAVAGGRKTQSIIDRCAEATRGCRILILTYTQANQHEIRARLGKHQPLSGAVEVQGWFSFLIHHWVRPYLPRRFPRMRLRGLNFDGDPGRYASREHRFFDHEGNAYKLHLAQLALETNNVSQSSVLDRLGRMFDEIYIDEVQDLNGYDLEVLSKLLGSSAEIRLVGDVRQALLRTNPKDPKNKQYKGIKIKNWFELQEKKGSLTIEHASTTWRSNQLIADFADSIFEGTWDFTRTASANMSATGHDGIFVVLRKDVDAYMRQYGPMCVRHSAASEKLLHLPFINFGKCKGLTADRVLIAPTNSITNFLKKRRYPGDHAACSLYVAVTRARFSASFISDTAEDFGLPVWQP